MNKKNDILEIKNKTCLYAAIVGKERNKGVYDVSEI